MRKIEQQIVKFITNEASEEEIEELTEWLAKGENKKVFKDFVKVNYLIDVATTVNDSSEVTKQLLARINNEKNVFSKKSFYAYYKYAAILILFLGGIYFFILIPQFLRVNKML